MFAEFCITDGTDQVDLISKNSGFHLDFERPILDLEKKLAEQGKAVRVGSMPCAELFLKPILARYQGARAEPAMISARLEEPLPANGPREHWMRAALSIDPQGRATVATFPDQDSSLVGVFSRADALVRRPVNAAAAPAGEIVEVLPLPRA